MKTKLFNPLASALLLFMAIVILAGSDLSAGISLDLNASEEMELNSMMMQPPRGQFGDTPEDSIQCVRNISLYTEYYNQRNYQFAYGPWRETFLNCPQSSQNIFIRGIILVKMKYNEETDPLRRDAWIDTLMMVHDRRIQYFRREGFVLGRKAVDLYQYRPNNVMEIYEMTKKSIELEGNSSQADVLLINMQTLVRLVEAGLRPVDDVLVNYDFLMAIIEHNLKSNPSDERFFSPAKNQVEAMFEPFATCENIITLFQPRFDKEPENVEILEKITSMLNTSNCTEEKLFYSATRNLHRIKPTAQSAFLMGRLENNSQNFREAINYFEQAVKLYETDNEKFTALMLLAEISRNLRQFSQTRAYALQASALQPENGRPYILIGEVYAASASACGDNELTKSVAYWAAVDKFVQARNVDSDEVVQERANLLINSYSQYFPDMPTIFFYGLSEGNTYRVECWINETTRIRARR